MGKKVGIITMHKVINYGSALQAYALQHVIKKMGHDVEIIDYIYPNEYHRQFAQKRSALRRLISYIIDLLKGSPRQKRVKAFEEFYKENLKLSRTYNSKEELHNDPPKYDVYMTGSDQVWNPRSIHEDTSFMLSFTDSPNKVAFSASIAKGEIPEQYKKLYTSELRKYKHIYMREKRGAELVESLIGYKPEVVLDPTMLLTGDEWREFAKKSNIDIKQPYILVYVLGYSFNVYPYIYDLIIHVQERLDMQLIVLNMNKQYAQILSNKKIIDNANVYDFVKLFANASMVITDSFHGTAFSLSLNVPFYSVVNNIENADSRISDLLTSADEKSRIIKKDTPFTDITIRTDAPDNNKLDILRKYSLENLSLVINDEIPLSIQ